MTRLKIVSLERFVTEFNGLRQEDWSRDQWNQVIELTTILPDSLLQLGDATWIVGNKFGLTDAAMSSMWDKLLAATERDLVVYDPKDLLPFVPRSRVERRPWSIMVRADELDAWFAKHCAPYRLIDNVRQVPHGAISNPDTANNHHSTWALKQNKRLQGYAVTLRSTLKSALAKGMPLPNSRWVLDTWAEQKPLEIYEVTNEGIKYFNEKGNLKFANQAAIQKVINAHTFVVAKEKLTADSTN